MNCWMCGQPVDDEWFCYGCKTATCQKHTRNENVAGFGHDPQEHTEGSACCDGIITIDNTCDTCGETIE